MADSRSDRAKGSGPAEYRTMIDRTNCREELAVAFKWLWRQHGAPDAILCIGTDRATGDALGPLVGTQLSTLSPSPFAVWGTLENPVHATNLIDLIHAHPRLVQARVLAVDASLGRPEEVGAISLGPGPIRPGAGVSKDLPAIGRYYVTGTVNIGGFMDYYVLQNTRLNLVMRMAKAIAEGIQMSLRL
ncbi:MAG: spore protease YyaC [Firmicutes bacterium]|nr:spore protease YyaC [Bacillota bacterium]